MSCSWCETDPGSSDVQRVAYSRHACLQHVPVLGIEFLRNLINDGARCWWRSCLRHCGTSRKVAGSIPDGVTGIFHWHNPSGRTVALDSTQPLTEVSTRSTPEGLRRPVRRADNLTTFIYRLSWNMGASTSWNPQGLSRPIALPIMFHTHSSECFGYPQDGRKYN